MRRAAATRALGLVASLGAAWGVAACSVLLDWSGFSGGAGDSGVDARLRDAGGRDAPGGDAAPVSCGQGGVCAAATPAGWTGPVALYVGASPAPPCPSGAPAFDGFGDLSAPPATCAPCACGAPAGVTCGGPVMSFFYDPVCSTSAGSPLTVTATTCALTTPGSFFAKVAAPQPTGGTCAPSGGTATLPATSWGLVVRACDVAPQAGSCPAGEACTATPAPPLPASLCVMQAGAATACPADFPSGPQLAYTGVDDTRGCSACACDPPAGGACSVGSPAIDVYQPPGCKTLDSTVDAPSGCNSLTGGQFVRLTKAPTLDDAGACAAPGASAPTGVASGSGVTSFCCAP